MIHTIFSIVLLYETEPCQYVMIISINNVLTNVQISLTFAFKKKYILLTFETEQVCWSVNTNISLDFTYLYIKEKLIKLKDIYQSVHNFQYTQLKLYIQ